MREVFSGPVEVYIEEADWTKPEYIELHLWHEEAKAAAHAINNHDKLVEVLEGLIWNAANNTGKEPSLSCFYLALIEAKKALKQAKGE